MNELRQGDVDAEPEEYQALRNGKTPQIVAGLDRPLERKPLGEQTRAVRRQAWMVILANVGVLSTGIALAMPTVTLNQLTSATEPVHLTQSQGSWFASLQSLSTPLGGLLSAMLLDKIGRVKTLYVLNITALVAWALLALAPQEDEQLFCTQLLASRFISGIAMGLATAPVGVYGAEISLPKLRGKLILGSSISVAAGITLLYIVGYFIRNDFRLIGLICCGYQIASLLCVLPLPETYSWLLSKRRVEKAKESLNYFRGLDKSPHITHPELLEEFNVLQKSMQLHQGEKKPSFIKCLRLPEVYKPLLILMGLFAFQQLTGIFIIIVYAVQISMEAGVTIDPFLCAVLIGASRVIMTCPMGAILEKWGRRRAGIISGLSMCVCMLLLAGHGRIDWLAKVPYLVVICIVGFIVVSTLGLYTLPFFMLSELFPQKVRGPASGLTVAVGMFISFVCIKMYPRMNAGIGTSNCFLVFAAMSLLAAIFVYFALPETRGRTLLEIEEQFRSGRIRRKKPADVEMQEVFVR
ncbi:facilitated trehalose transporter Tret1-2 homolog [Scaptodrosophila lebanonensis]|uniref:Facilitated trehalose transporter Tret1-2 homolog n=1 Tax=Drosophila lebanonensis TaxID=7225 RepID=A0A6J2TDV8_DROLE|nr:facilitated trehalose transporter Tret1-2 homolog [Scaptodrosophila lebanonensis]XP_030374187.1 facilitated trehalose transporter Tret1-2 homolog [Scaptodrosophila lebanonensis]